MNPSPMSTMAVSATPPIPTIETERLVLRAPTMADFETFAAFFATERSVYVGGPIDRHEAWRAFAANLGQWHLKGHGMWAVEERATGRHVGQIGIWHPEGWLAREVGWMILDPAAEGRGLAREAALAARGFAYGTFGWSEVFSVIDPGNVRSRALARRLGCTLDREAEWKGEPVEIWRHPAPGVEAAP
jgi:RimJ/RimL family protein N-acetyltransferase